MKLRVLATLAAIAACAAPLIASAGAAVGVGDLSYDDPGMHFGAPAGWERVPLGEAQGQEGAPVAVFALHRGKDVTQTITIMIDDQFDGSLGEFTTSRTQELRQSSGEDSATYVLKNQSSTLANGMPITFLEWTASLSSGLMTKTYEELAIDGKRSIDVRLSGLATDINDADAKDVFKTLYIVAYPASTPSP